MNRILGDEEAARLHEQDGKTDLATIHRLTNDQARMLLVYLSVVAPELWAEALAYVQVGVRR